MTGGRHRLRHPVLLAVLAAYAAFVCFVTLSPRTPGGGMLQRLVNDVLGALHRRGVALWADYLTVEFVGNVLMFVPLGILSALVLDARHRWLLLVAGSAFSGVLELTQLLLLPGRYADWRDLVSNTIGFLLGAGAALAVRSLARRRRHPGPAGEK
ncbi:VanZ family protein [Microbacterium sp. 4R-513]|uniref:VanZ family protein n=1 Tax=Microbacterium sp. 4R-513 TaxID=2567934 RepID=UPI0013E10E0D|nr:VanZ family protein [Microbacterium sp. 4R-513]QIG39935.1 VanZ family protein [Microbacterium sp. 4R-513]